jgi:molybdopterin molybdotransferase
MSLKVEEIAAQLQGYDPHSLRAADVNLFLERLVEPVRATEQVGIFDALGRVLAQDLVSPISVPPHDNSAMDGYAFDGAALADGGPVVLKVVGSTLAGEVWTGRVGPGEAVRITTGAVMPAGLDTVVPQEFVQLHADTVTLPAGVLTRGDNRRCLGEDLMQGMPALARGELLGPAALGLIASLGVAEVRVFRRLRVAYFSTGTEILCLGEPARAGAVFDSNRYTVFGLLRRLGIDVVDLGVVRDEPAALEAAFLEAARQADAIITSGGVSVGEADYTKAMMRKLAGHSGGVAFWRIAMRPGRPMAVGRIVATTQAGEERSAVLFGLPGNPVAVMVTFLAFVRPALLQMMGARTTAPPLLRARSTEAIRKKAGRTEYQRGTVTKDANGVLRVATTGNQGSGVLSSMVQANGLIVLHHAQGNVAVGDEVDVMMFDGAI